MRLAWTIMLITLAALGSLPGVGATWAASVVAAQQFERPCCCCADDGKTGASCTCCERDVESDCRTDDTATTELATGATSWTNLRATCPCTGCPTSGSSSVPTSLGPASLISAAGKMVSVSRKNNAERDGHRPAPNRSLAAALLRASSLSAWPLHAGPDVDAMDRFERFRSRVCVWVV